MPIEFKLENRQESLYRIYNRINIGKYQLCSVCNSPITKFISFKVGYREGTCGASCAQKTADARNKSIQTCLSKYGVENVGQSAVVKDKIAQTCIEKYGVNNVLKSPAIRHKINETTIANDSRFGRNQWT